MAVACRRIYVVDGSVDPCDHGRLAHVNGFCRCALGFAWALMAAVVAAAVIVDCCGCDCCYCSRAHCHRSSASDDHGDCCPINYCQNRVFHPNCVSFFVVVKRSVGFWFDLDFVGVGVCVYVSG